MNLPRPGPRHGAYPQRHAIPSSLWSDLADRLGNRLTRLGGSDARHKRRFLAALKFSAAGTVQAAHAHETEDDSAAGRHLKTQATVAAQRLARDGFTPESMACGQQAAAAAITATLGHQPYLSQHLAAFELLNGRLVEMDTGEGKSLAILLAAATAALARVPTHVITSNEYLAVRDAEAAQRVLGALGLRASAIRNAMTATERREAYACDVVYATAQEIGFDCMRDRQQIDAARRSAPSSAPPMLVLRGLCLALVDEADSVLLDHAQTPLVLAESSNEGLPVATAQAAWRFVAGLRAGADYQLDLQDRRVDIEPAVMKRLPHELTTLGDPRVQAAALRDALTARHALQPDVHYLVEDGDVVLLDQNTGRKLPGTVWSRGLQQMVHIKEGLAAPRATRTAMQITLQTLLSRYLLLAGISGTLSESRAALWFFYRLAVRRIEPRLPSQRRQLGVRLYAHRTQQLTAVAARAQALAAQGRAVLVGTDSVAAADQISNALKARNIAHCLLTARDDRSEAALIAAAGLPGTITVSTHMAGRGTDIALPPATLAAGGLHVISCAQNGSARIDRQLFGRAARNGRPGSCETILSLEDPAYPVLLPAFLLTALRCASDKKGNTPSWLAKGVCGLVHGLRAWSEFLRSYQLVRHDRLVRASLVFASPSE